MRPPLWKRVVRGLVGMEPAPIRSLCDETPKASGGTFYDDLNHDLQDPVVAAEFAANAERIQAIDAQQRAEPGRWEPRGSEATADLHAVDNLRSLEDRYLAVCERLREVTADRDRLDAANGRLVTRVHGLEETVRAYAGHTCDTAVMPRVRSHPAPGLAIDVTRPGDENDLLMRRPG